MPDSSCSAPGAWGWLLLSVGLLLMPGGGALWVEGGGALVVLPPPR